MMNFVFYRVLLEQVEEYRRAYYTNPFARCPPYLLGIFLGWILRKTRNAKIVIGKVNTSLWFTEYL